jgi:hypothetical protein
MPFQSSRLCKGHARLEYVWVIWQLGFPALIAYLEGKQRLWVVTLPAFCKL